MAKKYIKNKSKYVLSKFHQNVNGGKIYERDWVTIGGIDPFAPNQTPVYKSDNFIITVGNDNIASKSFENDEWETINGSDEWKLEDIEDIPTTDENEEISKNTDLKVDYYSLKDFAYFGSCVELVRTSINNILNTFPGELYAHTYTVKGRTYSPTIYYDDKSKGTSVDKIETKILGEGKFYLENPFNINIYFEHINENLIDNPLKYFANNGFKNYVIINGDSTEKIDITSYSVTNSKKTPLCVGDLYATVTLNGNVNIYVYKGEDKYYYFVDEANKNIHIRPKDEFYKKFINGLDLFERILMNEDTSPKYKATFEVITENDYGFKTSIKDFVFPLGNGGYNIGSNPSTLEKYIKSLSDIAAFYDNIFCDNLYRSLTHESIKNFDWTYRKLNEDETEMYQEGEDKITKILRIFGRAFDDIKLRIDSIKNTNNLSYDSINNTKDKNIASLCKNDGWDIIHTARVEYNGNTYNKVYSATSTPYDNVDKNGYFYGCFDTGDGCRFQKIENTEGKSSITDCLGNIVYAIHDYYSDKVYTDSEAFLIFLKRLRLNSRNIWRTKGTVKGLTEILGMLGLKKDRDYDIKEYILKTEAIDDTYIESKGDYAINWINKTKTIQYLDSEGEDYVGLPVIYRQIDDTNRKLYPYFNQYGTYDGNPYFMMNGGWLRKKPFIFNKKDEIIATENDSGNIIDLYSETLRSVSVVQNLLDLINLPKSSLSVGDIYYVRDLSVDYVVVDGMIYEIRVDSLGGTTNRYISVSVHSNTLQIGGTLFVGTVTTSHYNGTKTYNLNDLPNNYEIRIYINDENTITAEGNGITLSSVFVFENGQMYGEKCTHYFRLNTIEESNTIGDEGWMQLTEGSEDYKKLNIIVDYFEGNNPHCGHMKYDNGFEYLLYFKQIFKFAIDNGLFDERYYSGDLSQAIREAEIYGFKGLIPNEDDLCDNNYDDSTVRIEDKKIEYFSPDMNYDDLYLTVNTKWIDITFYDIPMRETNPSTNEKMKYYDSVIVPYMTQLLPSTAITTIRYKSESKTNGNG